MNEWPNEIPSICGKVRRNPKLAPDASSIRLFGPGVPEATKAKVNRAKNSVISMRQAYSALCVVVVRFLVMAAMTGNDVSVLCEGLFGGASLIGA